SPSSSPGGSSTRSCPTSGRRGDRVRRGPPRARRPRARDRSVSDRGSDRRAAPDAASACRAAEQALARPADANGLSDALARLSAAADGAGPARRLVDAYRAEVLRALGRPSEAAVAYADALLADVENDAN